MIRVGKWLGKASSVQWLAWAPSRQTEKEPAICAVTVAGRKHFGGHVFAVRDDSPDRVRLAVVLPALLLGLSFLTACGSPTSPTATSTASQGGRDLQLRPVLAVSPPGASACPSENRDAASTSSPVTACSTDGKLLYSLGAAGVIGDQIASVSVQDSASGGTSEIQVTLNDAGTSALSKMTTDLASKSDPQSQMAIYIHGRVQSAPSVMAPITTGAVTVAGDFTHAQAQQIVDGLAVN